MIHLTIAEFLTKNHEITDAQANKTQKLEFCTLISLTRITFGSK